MDDVAFDFERGLEATVGQPVEPPASMPAAGRKNYRMVGALLRVHTLACALTRDWTPRTQTVCRHWLRGLCMKGNACGFLHQFEASRMPVCRFFAKYGECKASSRRARCRWRVARARRTCVGRRAFAVRVPH